jgi:hypothetical protein
MIPAGAANAIRTKQFMQLQRKQTTSIYSIKSVNLILKKNLCNRFFFIYARLKISHEQKFNHR